MKRVMTLCLSALLLIGTLAPTALAAEIAAPCYPTSVTRSEDGGEIRKVYDLSPEEDPAGIPRSDFEQDGFRYTLVDLLKQEAPAYEERSHTETVSLESKSRDMASVLALLPQEREFVTEDGLTGTLTLKLDTVQIETAGYGSATKEVSAKRSYPNLVGQDTQYIPKTIEEDGRTLTLQSKYVATYSGTATSSYVTGYTVTAEYAGTVSRINLDKVRYVAVYEGTPLTPVPVVPEQPAAVFRWRYVLIPLGIVAAAGAGIGAVLFIKRRREESGEEENG